MSFAEDTVASDRAILKRSLVDRNWRLANLYYIIDKDGHRVKFSPNWAQEELLANLHTRNVILKARQIGFTTFIQLLMLDECVFRENVRCGTIAHNLESAQAIFKDKVKYPYDNLPEGIRLANPEIKDSQTELMLRNNSSLRVATSFRGGTFQFLHISELGKIASKTPDKAQEIRTGAINAVGSNCFVFVESTAEGTDNDFHSICSDAITAKQRQQTLSKLDFKFHFFPWFCCPDYKLNPSGVVIPETFSTYFDSLATDYHITLSDSQKAWYVKTASIQLDDMKQEYPSTPQEAFEASVEGTYYRPLMDRADTEGRVGRHKAEPGFPVNTSWDLGMDDATSVWFWQRLPGEVRLVGFLQNSGEAIPYYAQECYRLYEKHGWSREGSVDWFPHDVKVRELSTGKTRLEAFIEHGFKPQVTPNLNLADGIHAVRLTLPLCTFDLEGCKDGIDCLRAYRKSWNEEKGVWSDRPYHNWASHGADAFRYLAVAHQDISETAPPVQETIDSGLITLGAIRNELIKQGKERRRFLRK